MTNFFENLYGDQGTQNKVSGSGFFDNLYTEPVKKVSPTTTIKTVEPSIISPTTAPRTVGDLLEKFKGQELTMPKKAGGLGTLEEVKSKFAGQELTQTRDFIGPKPENKIDENTFAIKEFYAGKASYQKNPETGKIELTSPEIEVFRKAPDSARAMLLDMQSADTPLNKWLTSQRGSAVVTDVADKTSNIGLKTFAKAKEIGSLGRESYTDAYEKLLEGRNDPDNTMLEKVLYGMQDSIPQTVIGVGLGFIPVVGSYASTAYFATLSASSEISKEGGPDGSTLRNILIDTLGDRLLGGMLEKMFMLPAVALKSSIVTALKGASVEGGTEVTQTLLKYANSYASTKDEAKRASILAEAKEYITSGDMAVEFLVGAAAGGVISGAGQGVQVQLDRPKPSPIIPVEPDIIGPQPQPTPTAPIQTAVEEKEGQTVEEPELVKTKTAQEIIDYVNELDLSTENPDFAGDQAGILPFTKKRIKENDTYELQALNIDDLIKKDPDLKEYVDYNEQRYVGERDFFNLENPIVVGKNGEIIDGMNRILTLKNNGETEIKGYVAQKATPAPATTNKADYTTWLKANPAAMKMIAETTEKAKTIPNSKDKFAFLRQEKAKFDTKFANEFAKEQKLKVEPKPEQKFEETKPAETEETTKFKSRVYERLAAERPDVLPENVEYERKTREDQVNKAIDLIKEDKQKAFDIAMGNIQSDELLATTVNIALAEQAKDEGNMSLYNTLTRNRSFAQTRRGQEMEAEKGSVSNNQASRFVKQLINSRLADLGKKYTTGIKETFKKSSAQKLGLEKIDTEVKKTKEKIKKTKELDLSEAQAIIDRLTCA